MKGEKPRNDYSTLRKKLQYFYFNLTEKRQLNYSLRNTWGLCMRHEEWGVRTQFLAEILK
jgi:hypothetical protein